MHVPRSLLPEAASALADHQHSFGSDTVDTDARGLEILFEHFEPRAHLPDECELLSSIRNFQRQQELPVSATAETPEQRALRLVFKWLREAPDHGDVKTFRGLVATMSEHPSISEKSRSTFLKLMKLNPLSFKQLEAASLILSNFISWRVGR